MAEVVIGNIKFNSYDLGGHIQARKTWREYSGSVDGIIFMVDAADIDRISEARDELQQLMAMPEHEEKPIVVFGNKVDKLRALGESQFREQMFLPYHLTYGKQEHTILGRRPIEVFMCSVKARVGYQDGFEWLTKFIV